MSDDRDQRDIVATLTDQARDVAAWDNDRIQNFERKAGVLLGAAGTVLTILLGLVTLVDGQQHAPPTTPMVWAAGLLLASVASAAVCLLPKTTSYVSVAQLKTAWQQTQPQIKGNDDTVADKATDDEPLRPIAAEAISLRALLEGQPASMNSDGSSEKEVPAGLDSLRSAAKLKAGAFRACATFFVLGVGTAGVLVITTIKGATNNG